MDRLERIKCVKFNKFFNSATNFIDKKVSNFLLFKGSDIPECKK